jgi:hypothetical protein
MREKRKFDICSAWVLCERSEARLLIDGGARSRQQATRTKMSSVKEFEGACRCGAGGSRNGLLDILWSGDGRGEAARRKGLLEAKLPAPGEGARWPD